MPENSGQERTEEATPKRRRDARRKGTVARSIDLNSSLALLTTIFVLPSAIGMMGNGFLNGMRASLGNLPSTLEFGSMTSQAGRILIPALPGLALLMFAIMAVGISANFAQVGFVLSAEPLTPSFSKINPFEGFKRLFSQRAVFDAAKAALKAGLFAYLVWTEISGNWSNLIALSWLTPQASISVVGSMLKGVAIKI